MANGITKKNTLSHDLAEFMGKPKASRGEVNKALWVHIKKHELQDPDNRRKIHPDDVLAPILGTRSFTMFEMAKLITPHFLVD